MVKSLLLCGAMVLDLVGSAAAQMDPKSLVGVWEGTWNSRASERQYSGPITVTITKVDDSKVYGKTESTDIRGQNTPPVIWTSGLTPTGFHGVGPQGFPTTGTLDGDKLLVITQRAGVTITSTLIKKK